ncbi:RNA polymerase alpha subunit C-terminal domain-containing protein [Pedobacter sp. Hv1]|uniref:RNA polymerase alpha subunit C-terminal domain-containing protein n=1 Tax=Pedobacter sp. Hv1 TaxID=1740090 RepID=UPI0006D89FB4|nr:RNA polymerase alpha subunit C-terminal domain-containing protein [Pedobacter sp. Hv1]KQC00317.1 hypothetical protein AQF98_12580 [Pedobacter sp. Hv1]
MASIKTLKICPKGHRFYKSSDCPSCPICENEQRPETGFLSLLSAPARRALVNAGITSLNQLTTYTPKQVLAFHGVGPSTIPILREALAQQNLDFKA